MHKPNQTRGTSALVAMATTLLALLPAPARAQLISVDFNGFSGATQSGAAVIGSAGDQWNGITTGTPNPHALNTTTGAASGVSLTTVSMGSIGPFGPPTPFASTPYNALFQDGCLIGQTTPPASMTFTGLQPNEAYELYFYAQDNAAQAGTTTFTINGNAVTVNYDGTTNTFIEGTTYGRFASVLASGTGTMAIDITGTGNLRGVVNGLQLNRPIPEPTALGSIAVIAATMARRRRRGDCQ